ncbi:MAG: long-chain fatty acid--CoA ligase [Dehalococcoidia bacterium]|nr:long-chain fatty acid--CoA ligase [Dehalococcoidia bacterium]
MVEYPWYRSYDSEVPHSLEPYPAITVLDIIAETTKEMPDHTFMYFKDRYYTYREASRLFEVMASALMTNGVKPGGRVASMLLNTPQQLIAAFGTMKAGGIYVPLNPLYNEDELIHALTTIEAEVLVVWDLLYDSVKKVQPRTKLKLIIATSLEDGMLPEAKKPHAVQLQPGDLWWDELIAKHAGDPAPQIKPGLDDTAVILFSGGTTGAPKGAMISFRNMVAVALQSNTWNKSGMMTHNDYTVALMPLFHAYGFNGIIGSSLAMRSPLAIVPNPRDLDDVIATVKKLRPASMPGVPTLFIGLMEHPEVKTGKVDFSCLKFCLSGAIPLMVETKQRWEAMTGARILEAYGLTETTVVLTVGPMQGQWKEGSVGLPMPDVIIKFMEVTDPDKELPYGQEGEVVAKGPQIMQGYWNNPEGTAEMIRDGWLYTGDIGYMDKDGYLYLTSRKKDLIKPSGHQVWPREVEEVIAEHHAVSEVGVAGIPDKYQVEAVKAWVVLKQGEKLTSEELQVYCRDKLTAYKVPKYIEFRDALPKTLVGKILRRVLQEEEKARQSKPA